MRVLRRGVYKYCYAVIVIVCLIYYLRTQSFNLPAVEEKKTPAERQVFEETAYDGPFPDSKARPGQERVDWHDRVKKEKDASRTGPGEHGAPAHLPPGTDKQKAALFETNGFNALLSDQIPLDRALRDIRHSACKSKLYNAELPTVSVVVPFFEEHWTTLLRTVVSVVNNSPPQLLREIILVDDGSTMKDFLRSPLEEWLAENQPKAKVVRLPERKGLILARQTGAREAAGDVIVVLDSHCEVMVNWLPPLLDPIVEDYRTAVCPLIDVINQEDFSYHPQDNGGRGAFDWRLFYKRLPLRHEEESRLPEPFEDPVMNGGLFAISRKFFWELGGYDEGLRIWGGEQYELSFKVWQCGGRLLDAPCSRVGHVFRHAPKGRPSVNFDFLTPNYKRVAVVWMDEFAEALYRKNPRLRSADPGDVSKQLAVRKKLNCKPFKWFLDNVLPDLAAIYPPFEPPDYANGTVKSEADLRFCIDTGARETGPLILYGCHGYGTQYFALCWRKTVRVESEQFCWASPSQAGKPPVMEHCQAKSQSSYFEWRYDVNTHQIQNKAYKYCIEANLKEKSLSMEVCNSQKVEQRWIFKNVDKALIFKEYSEFS